MQALHTASLWPVFILVCVLSHCGVVAGNKKTVEFFSLLFLVFVIGASFVTGVPVRPRSGNERATRQPLSGWCLVSSRGTGHSVLS